MGALESFGIRTHKLTVEAYHRMGAAGVFAPDARSELIRGEVVDMAPIGTKHASVVRRLNQRLSTAAGARGLVAVRDPIQLDTRSEPQPDLALLAPRADFYSDRHPLPADVLLIIEVADTTLRYDREVKMPLYAEAGVREAWLVDVEARSVTIHRDPAAAAGYRSTREALPGETVTLAADPAIAVSLTDLF